MGTDSGIEYVNHSMGFWKGCHPIDECCDHCYAADNAKKYGWDFSTVQRTSKSIWRQPFVKSRDTKQYKWKAGERIFVCSLSDFFHRDADRWRPEAMQVIRDRPDLVWLIVTKRIERVVSCFGVRSLDFTQANYPNLWIIPTCGTQRMANRRIPIALAVRIKYPWINIGVSAEPLLEEIDFERNIDVPNGRMINFLSGDFWNCIGPDGEGHAMYSDMPSGTIGAGRGIDQVFVGAESRGVHPGRVCDPVWIRNIADQFKTRGKACFVKQVRYGRRLIKDPEEIKSLNFPQELANR